jgi:hypothetical protein
VIVIDMRAMGNRGSVFALVLCVVLACGCIGDQDAGKGTLSFSSSPSGAEVYLDNQYRGTTPDTLAGVEPGIHTLEYRHAGYRNWSSQITVAAGTSQYYAALSLIATGDSTGQETGQGPDQTSSTPKVTVQAGRDPMIIGDSTILSGTCTVGPGVVLTLFGPGKYQDGVVIAEPRVNSAGIWSYTWSPGTSIQSGAYTLIAADTGRTASARTTFSVIGGGIVSVVPSSYATYTGSTMTFSGRCTSGAPNVMLVLYGPGRYSGGIDLGTVSVLSDKTWSFRYKLDAEMPTGTYTMYAYDVPKTTVGTTQFTVGYVSSS